MAADVQERLTGIPKPVDYDLLVAGNFEEQQKAFHELLISLLLALALVYMVMACQYESLLNPLVVMLSVPLAGIGVLLILYPTHTTFNLQSAIGCIMLGGIAVNNAILLVDQAGRLSREGFPVREAVAEAGRRRLRPILMTTLTTIFGLLTLALGIEVERNRKQISAAAATRRLEEATLQAEKERFEVGAGTALRVAQEQRDLLASQIAEVRAIINYRLALVQLYLAEGSLLERRGVVFDEG